MRRKLRLLLLALLVVLGPVTVLGGWILWPPSLELDRRGAGAAVTIEDRNGLPLRSTRASDGSRERWVPYDRLDPDLINAFVAVEDRRFWDHGGIDLIAVLRAARDNVRARRVVSGASTITMQLARLLRSGERTWSGKFGQALWALRLEYHLTKQEILEQYLNRVHLGHATVGVGAASALYFGGSATSVSVGQAALLAGIAHAPSRDNPFTSPGAARGRRLLALARMRRAGYASSPDVARAREEPLVSPRRESPFLAPHFTTRVLTWSAEELAGNGTGGSARTTSVSAPGSIRTSLDLPLQTQLEAEVRHTVDVLRDRGVRHAAVVVIDNASGEVLAWVGSADFWSSDDGQTDMVVSRRQPGSALKPFLYGLAFDRGYTAASVLPDIPRTYTTATGPYRPRNYDRRFRGPVRAREALASSYNVPAVELAAKLGTGSVLETLRRAGFESLDREAEHYGLGLALGNGDVTLIELANAYRALANGGEWRPWSWRANHPAGSPATAAATTRRADVASGRAARDRASEADRDARRVMSAMSSALVLDILRDPAARIPGFGPTTPFDFPFPVAVKTGTSRHYTDNWAVGTTRGFSVAVWVGDFSGRPMEGVSGVTGAGPLLHRAVLATAQRVAPGSFTTPAEAGASAVPICRLSGLRATASCAQLMEWFAPGSEPSREDDWERGGRVSLPAEYADWAEGSRRGLAVALAEDVTATGANAGAAPTGSRAVDAQASRSSTVVAGGPAGATGAAGGAPIDGAVESRPLRFRIISPLDGDRYSVPAGVDPRFATIALRAVGPGAEGVRWFVDGKPHASARWVPTSGAHIIRAVSGDGETVEVRVVVED